MASRMDKYDFEDGSRTTKNEKVYDNIYSKDYDFDNTVTITPNEVSLDKEGTPNSRAAFRSASANIFKEKTEEETDIQPLIPKEKKVYDINSIIEEKKQEREEDEQVKNLKNTQYNIFSSIKVTSDELEKTITIERENIKANKEELTELINTISQTSINKDLLGDLMDEEDSVTDASIEIDKEEIEEKKEELKEKQRENTFYDGTGVIRDKDIEEELQEEKKGNTAVKVLMVILFLIILAIGGYLAYKYFL